MLCSTKEKECADVAIANLLPSSASTKCSNLSLSSEHTTADSSIWPVSLPKNAKGHTHRTRQGTMSCCDTNRQKVHGAHCEWLQLLLLSLSTSLIWLHQG